MHAMKAKVSSEMHITEAAETTGGDAATISRPIIWWSKLLIGKTRKNHSGRKSFIYPVEKDLLQYVFNNCEQCIQVTTMLVRKHAKKLLP